MLSPWVTPVWGVLPEPEYPLKISPSGARGVTRSASSTAYTNSSLGLMTENTSAGVTAYTRSNSGEIVGSRAPNAANVYFILDSLGSVVGLFDKAGSFSGGYSYAPYGETRSSSNSSVTNSNSLRYIASYFDSSVNLYRLGARYYDTAQARFTQFDPSGQERNPYAYASGDPIGASDASGLITDAQADLVATGNPRFGGGLLLPPVRCGAFLVLLVVVRARSSLGSDHLDAGPPIRRPRGRGAHGRVPGTTVEDNVGASGQHLVPPIGLTRGAPVEHPSAHRLGLRSDTAAQVAAGEEGNGTMPISDAARQEVAALLPGSPSDLATTDPEFIELHQDFAFDEVLRHTSLSRVDRLTMQLGAIIAVGGQTEYRTMLGAALNGGVTPVVAKEVVYQATAYVGMARSVDFLRITNEVLAERGVQLPLEGQSTTTPADRLAVGRATQSEIVGAGVVDGMYETAPADAVHVQEFLSGNCFGDYYTRTGLDVQRRELLTFAILVGLGGADAQVAGHVAMNRNVGNTRQDLLDVLTVLVPYVGYPRTLNGLAAINDGAPAGNGKEQS